MTLATRMTLILTLLFPVAADVSAQQTDTAAGATQTATATPAPAQTPTVSAAEEERPSDAAIREKFLMLLDRHPSQVSRILALDPLLLNNEPFLARYPDIADFVTRNPELRRNPHYFVRRPEPERQYRPDPLGEALEGLAIFMTVALVVFALGWFLRTLIEQRRWNRLSRQQAEVHNKILDRFGTSAELLEYVKSAAGSKFLESAPIPVRVEPRRISTPVSRVVLTIQAGVVLAAAALGLLLLGAWFDGDAAAGFFAMGVIAFCIGAGFIASSVVSIVMSRRLGLWREESANPPGIDDRGLVR